MQVGEPRAYPGREQGVTTSYEELLSMALRNATNSFSLMAMEGENLSNRGRSSGHTETYPSEDRYTGNLMILWAHILEKNRSHTVNGSTLARLWDKTGEADGHLDPWIALHHGIVQMVDETGLLSGKVRRSLVGA